MSNTNETLADILADMRRDAADDDYTEDCILGQSLNEYADRIEAAAKREKAAPPRNCDRYPTLGEAVLASGECTAEAPSLLGMGNAQLVRFAKWLFAKAEGKEEESNV